MAIDDSSEQQESQNLQFCHNAGVINAWRMLHPLVQQIILYDA
jgi:hypothetical protein